MYNDGRKKLGICSFKKIQLVATFPAKELIVRRLKFLEAFGMIQCVAIQVTTLIKEFFIFEYTITDRANPVDEVITDL